MGGIDHRALLRFRRLLIIIRPQNKSWDPVLFLFPFLEPARMSQNMYHCQRLPFIPSSPRRADLTKTQVYPWHRHSGQEMRAENRLSKR